MQLKRIIELPKQIYDKIAAGEVVDRPVSIVKELLENSIDAGADQITVEIKNGGKSYIRITDNGSGIIREEAELAFKRHATSKIKSVQDLDKILTLGFRGEALASISAVSKTELITKTKNDNSGLRISIEGGEIVERNDIGCVDGTSVMVNSLFYNTPARLKFLKSDNVESRLIIDFVSKMTLAYPQIRFRMINNGSTLFSTPGKGNVLQCIQIIFGAETGKNLVSYKSAAGEAVYEGMSLEAYISPPSITKTNRKSQIFFVNGRAVSSRVLENAVADAYRERLFDGRYPTAFLFLTVDPAYLDVNIHPNKKEIRFQDDKIVRSFVASELRRALLTEEALPQYVHVIPKKRNDVSFIEIITPEDSLTDIITETETIDINVKKHESAGAEENIDSDAVSSDTARTQTYKPEQLKIQPSFTMHDDENSEYLSSDKTTDSYLGKQEYAPKKLEHAELAEKQISGEAELRELLRLRRKEQSEEGENASSANIYGWSKPEYAARKFDILSLEPIGTVFATYIIARDPENMYVIDQHAAHERVFYEKLLARYFSSDKLTQAIILPVIIETTHALKHTGDDWLKFINTAGFDIIEFGPRSFSIKGIPSHMTISEAERFVRDFLDNVDEKTDFKDQKKIGQIIRKACKSAVKANYNMTIDEIRALLRDLAAASNPFSCPHGRPTIIRITKHELEHMFKRV